jgi:hypothetical protein
MAGVAIAGGAVKGGLIAIGKHRASENASERVGEANHVGLAAIGKAKGGRVFANQVCSGGEAQDGRIRVCGHVFILKGFRCFRKART